MNEKTFKVETMTTPATDKQIRTIININTKYIIKGIKYPETKFFSKAHAIMMLDELTTAVNNSEGVTARPFDRDMYYTLYERFAAKYPDNNMRVPVRDYRVDTEDIPDDDKPTKPKGLPTKEEVNRFTCNRVFNAAITRDFLKVD